MRPDESVSFLLIVRPPPISALILYQSSLAFCQRPRDCGTTTHYNVVFLITTTLLYLFNSNGLLRKKRIENFANIYSN